MLQAESVFDETGNGDVHLDIHLAKPSGTLIYLTSSFLESSLPSCISNQILSYNRLMADFFKRCMSR